MAKKKRKSYRRQSITRPPTKIKKMPKPVARTRATGESKWGGYLDSALYYGLLILAFLLPLIFERFTYDQFDLPKMVFLRLVTLVLLCIYLVRMLISARTELRFSPLFFLAVAFLISVFISTILSVHVPTAVFGKYRRYEGLLTFTTYAVILFLAVQVFKDFSRRRSLAEVMVASAAIASFYGLIQFLGLDPFKWAEVPFELKRSFSTYGNPTLLSGYLVIAFPLALTIFLSTEERWESITYGIFTLMIFSCLLTAMTRASWLGMGAQLMAATFLFPFVYMMFNHSLAAKVRRFSIISYSISAFFFAALIILFVFRLVGGSDVFGYAWNTAILITFGGFALIYLPPFLWLIFKYFRTIAFRILALIVMFVLLTLGLNMYTRQYSRAPMNLLERASSVAQVEAGSAGTRVEIWKAALKMIRDRPVFGFGPDTFRLVSRIYQTKVYAKLSQFTVADNAHNYFLQIGAGTGLAGLALFLMIVCAFFVLSGMTLKESTGLDDFFLSGAFLLAALGYLVHLIFSVSVVGGSTFLWLIFGVVAAQSGFTRTLSLTFTASTAWLRTLVAIVIVFFALTGMKYTIDIYYADVYFASASQLIRSGYFEQGIESYQTAMSLFPYMDRYQSDLGALYQKAYEQTGQEQYIDLAIKYLKKANKTSPLETDNIVFLANAYLMKAKADPKYYKLAMREAKRSTEIAPYLSNGHLLLGLSYMQTGKFEEAVKELKIAVEFNPNSVDGLASLGEAYEKLGKKDEALKSYQAALKVNPDFARAKDAYERLKKQ